MINLSPGADEIEVAELARSVGAELLEPAARAAEAAAGVPVDVWDRLHATGLVTGFVAGGTDEIPSALLHARIVEGLAYGDPGLALAAAWSGAAELLLARHGTADQVAVASGRRPALALYEGYGRSPSELQTTIATSPGGVRVAGTKIAVSATDGPLVVIGVDPAGSALRAALVPVGAAGVEVCSPGRGLALDAGRPTEVRLDVAVGGGSLLVPASDAALRSDVERIRLLLAAALVGCGQHAVDHAASYATERVAFGRPIAGFQGVSFPLAEAHARLEAVRLEIGLVAEALDAGVGADTDSTSNAVSYAAQVGQAATRAAVQTLGGHGFMADHPVERWFRSATALAAIDFDVTLAPFVPAL
jgi:alkylation response protein AidB-like acyl-CoA dehydrogenase